MCSALKFMFSSNDYKGEGHAKSECNAYEPRRGKRAVMVYANSKGSGETAHPAVSPELLQFAHVSGRPKRHFSQRASLINISKRPACALKD